MDLLLARYAGVTSNGQTYVAWNWDMGADTPTGFGVLLYKGVQVMYQALDLVLI